MGPAIKRDQNDGHQNQQYGKLTQYIPVDAACGALGFVDAEW